MEKYVLNNSLDNEVKFKINQRRRIIGEKEVCSVYMVMVDRIGDRSLCGCYMY